MPGLPAPLAGWTVDDFRTEMRTLVRIAMAAGATPPEAEDAMQAAMTDLVRRLRAGEQIHSPRPYLRRAVWNHFVSAAQRDRRHVKRLIDAGYSKPEGVEDSGFTIWEDEQFITELLDQLPPAQREVMEYVLEGLTPSEIGDLLGKKPATIRQNLKFARDKLRTVLAQPSSGTACGSGCGSRCPHRPDVPDPPTSTRPVSDRLDQKAPRP